MLTSWQNVPRAIFKQIKVAIMETSVFRYIESNNAANRTNKTHVLMELKYHFWSDHVGCRHINMTIIENTLILARVERF